MPHTDLHIRFAPHSFGWMAGRQAASQLRAEGKRLLKLMRSDPPAGREALWTLLALLWPATMQINRAHGELDDTLERSFEPLIELLVRQLEQDPSPRADLLERLWLTVQADVGGITDPIAQHFGRLCGPLAAEWAQRLLPELRHSLARDPQARCPAALPTISALAQSGQAERLLAVLTVGAPREWLVRRFALDGLARDRGLDEALRFADEALCRGEAQRRARAQWAEAALRAAGRDAEAFERYALQAHAEHTVRQSFEALCEAWPERSPRALFEALRAAHAQEPGKLFATARALGDLALATALIQQSAPDPKVVLRAALDVLEALDEATPEGAQDTPESAQDTQESAQDTSKSAQDAPESAQDAEALRGHARDWIAAILHWLGLGRAYKVTQPQIAEAAALWLRAHPPQAKAQALRWLEESAVNAPSPSYRRWMRAWLDETASSK